MSSKVKDGLFLGDVDAAQDAEFLQLNGIVHIVNCVPRQVPNLFQQSLGLDYVACELDEVLKRPFFDLKNRQFMGIVQLIDRALDKTESVLVHSLTGVNRSPSVMMGYLMVKYCWGVDKAYEFLLTKRTDIKPHESYIDQLCLLEAQLQGHFGNRATEQQLYEWHPALADPLTDEVVLVHTYLNTPSSTTSKPPNKNEPIKPPSARRLSWIDQIPHMKKMHPSLMIKPERPPNHSYNDMVPANGWFDLLAPANTRGNEGSGALPRPIAAFMETSVATNSTNPLHRDMEPDDDEPIVNRSHRVHSFSVPRRREIELENGLSPTSTSSERDDPDLLIDVTPPVSSLPVATKQSAIPRYQQQIRGSISAPNRSTHPLQAPPTASTTIASRTLTSRNSLSSTISTMNVSYSLPASSTRFSSSFKGPAVTSTVMTSSWNKSSTVKTPEYTKPGKPATRTTTTSVSKPPPTAATKQSLERRPSVSTSNGSYSARGTNTGDLPLPQPTSAYTIRRSLIDTEPWAASFSSASSTATRPRTAPPRLRKKEPEVPTAAASTSKTNGVNRVNLDVWTLPSSNGGSSRRVSPSTDGPTRTTKPTTSKPTVTTNTTTTKRPTRAQWK